MCNGDLKSFPITPFLIGIGGGTGSGKSHLTKIILSSFPADEIARIDCDSYYRDISHLPLSERLKINFDDPDTLDLDLLLKHLQDLLKGQSIKKPLYDFATHLRSSETEVIIPSPILLLEGIFAFCDARIRSSLHYKIYVDSDPDLRLIRRLRRDVAERGRSINSVIDQYLNSVRPMHSRHIEPTKAFADLILDNSNFLDTAPVLLRIRELVAQHRRKR
jgi:uridine kinase